MRGSGRPEGFEDTCGLPFEDLDPYSGYYRERIDGYTMPRAGQGKGSKLADDVSSSCWLGRIMQ